MKNHTILLSLGLLLAALSCEKQPVLTPLPETTSLKEETGTLHVSVGTTGTKASLAELNEKSVRCLQVFVFNAESGKLETDKFVSESSAALTSPVGNKRIWAIVNHSRLTGIGTETDLKNRVTNLAENYTAENGICLVMAGKMDVAVNGARTDVSVDVVRLASRIVLSGVTRKFADTYLEGRSFTIKDIYLKNVAGNTNFSLDKTGTASQWDIMAPTLWHNQRTEDGESPVRSLVSDHGLSIACAENTPTAINRVWYTCPNPTADDSTDNTWSPRHTRLVIHAEVGRAEGNIQSYYTFTLPELQRNCSYEISNITFTMLGKDNDNDDTVTDTGSASITLNVLDWDSSTPLRYNM